MPLHVRGSYTLLRVLPLDTNTNTKHPHAVRVSDASANVRRLRNGQISLIRGEEQSGLGGCKDRQTEEKKTENMFAVHVQQNFVKHVCRLNRDIDKKERQCQTFGLRLC